MGNRVGELLLVADDEGRIIDVNDRVLEVLGYSREELLELSIWDLTPGAKVLDGLELWQQFMRAGNQAGEYSLRTKSGRVVRFAYRAEVDLETHRHESRLRPLD